ncbi:C39 family peptidase [Synechococcus sp. BA-132 BA5]|uniref:C39 family peptidase n=1 Tax=Synechococcus sp. BA-132 BA5 TaxID=3110252 RepID=UPI002B21ED96|nr:C39 family peptidase [Synechococcus sp. BA-132 BA5]MEA5414026.1 C39 family peptidase [Synechococcus sp. BA-132 BA5]
MTNIVPQKAISLIQEFEGCHRLKPGDDLVYAYPDPLSGGKPFTIGWGTTVYPDGRKVEPLDSISKEDADTFFTTTLQGKFWEPLFDKIPAWAEMNDSMRSALCSFAYNLGVDFYGGDGFKTISAALREKRWDDVPKALMLYVNPGSNVEAGLRRRRDAEGDLWRQGLELLSGNAAPAAKQDIFEAMTETFLKKEKVDSSQLSPQHLVPVETGRQYKIEEILEKADHSMKVRLAYGAGDWWVYLPHWRSAVADAVSTARAAGPNPERIVDTSKPHLLKVPHLSQLDNRQNPTGSCNVTCVAMCLIYLGMEHPPGIQLEDVLYQKMEKLGWSRHDPHDLKALIDSYPGYKDIFRQNGGFKDIQTSIDAGNPVIIHGYFTKFGHIIVVCGYDDKGFIVNDPNGEYFSSGYDRSRSGENLHYSYGLIARTCSPESVANPKNIWYHTVFRV